MNLQFISRLLEKNRLLFKTLCEISFNFNFSYINIEYYVNIKFKSKKI